MDIVLSWVVNYRYLRMITIERKMQKRDCYFQLETYELLRIPCRALSQYNNVSENGKQGFQVWHEKSTSRRKKTEAETMQSFWTIFQRAFISFVSTVQSLFRACTVRWTPLHHRSLVHYDALSIDIESSIGAQSLTGNEQQPSVLNLVLHTYFLQFFHPPLTSEIYNTCVCIRFGWLGPFIQGFKCCFSFYILLPLHPYIIPSSFYYTLLAFFLQHQHQISNQNSKSWALDTRQMISPFPLTLKLWNSLQLKYFKILKSQ